MRLIYTEIDQDLTAILVKEALDLSKAGQRVFYIAPNSLSFEKERQVLTYLPQKASFDILVTRFGQMARYMTLNGVEKSQPIDDNGLVMLFYRALSQLPENSLKVYGRLRQNMDFIQQLVALHKELQDSGTYIGDLVGFDSLEKQEDLTIIFNAFYALVREGNYQEESQLSQLTKQITSGHFKTSLETISLVIDGFTRFSLEEEALVAALEAQGVPIVVGTYASPTAYQAIYSSGNLYQAGVDFLRNLSQKFGVVPNHVTGCDKPSEKSLKKLSQHFQSRYDFSLLEEQLTDEDTASVSIWEVISQKEEVIHVAKQIRYYLQEGYRYKDILVLLGDVDSYRLQIGKIFDQYEIPYYFAKAQAMSQHPLVNFIDSLWRLKRYRFQTEDVLNLLKTGLYGRISQEDLDRFEQYLYYAQIKGRQAFLKPFSLNQGERYDLSCLNSHRESLMKPILDFLQIKPMTGQALLERLKDFLNQGEVASHLANLSETFGLIAKEEAEQVWQTFIKILEQFYQIFGQVVLTVEEALSLIRAGLMGANFRTVPATVDVVNVKSYDLITPHANKLVFAIGLTQGNFPKFGKNTSLLSDQERYLSNEAIGRTLLEVPSQEQSKRNHFAALSLLHAATEHLVLSYPQLFNDSGEQISPYLGQLIDLGVKKIIKGKASFEINLSDIGNYKGLLSQIILLNRMSSPETLTETQETFWSVAARYLRQRLAKEGLSIPQISSHLETKPLAKDTLATLYPKDHLLRLSASSLADFYNSQYKYFLKHVLGLRELETVLPDARVHGTFLHKVFEEILRDQSGEDFDSKVEKALAKTSQLEAFRQIYDASSESSFSKIVLTEIAHVTASVLRDDQVVKTVGEEQSFEKLLNLPEKRQLSLVGKIDRIDQVKTNQALGVIDYKSSAQTFQMSRFFNGLSPQLMTYILALTKGSGTEVTKAVFGAMYLHMTNPIIPLSKLKDLDELAKAKQDILQFKGLFIQEFSQDLTTQYGKTAATTFSQDEMILLLNYTENLYKQAAQQILQGSFAINPYTEDGRSVVGDQYSSITHFEADLHLGQARKLAKFGRKKEDWLSQMNPSRD